MKAEGYSDVLVNIYQSKGCRLLEPSHHSHLRLHIKINLFDPDFLYKKSSESVLNCLALMMVLLRNVGKYQSTGRHFPEDLNVY
jgi:hypothetical protein